MICSRQNQGACLPSGPTYFQQMQSGTIDDTHFGSGDLPIIGRIFHRAPNPKVRILSMVFISLVVLLTCGVANSVRGEAFVLDDIETFPLPQFTDQQSRTTKLIHYLIDKTHFLDVNLDNQLSEKILERYISALDPSRSFFLSQDIEEFSTVRHELDEHIRLGNIEAAFNIFHIYRNRVEKQMEFALLRLQEPFDFTLDENFTLNRENPQWAVSGAELDDHWRKRIKNDILNLRLSGKSEEGITDTLTRRYTHIARQTRQFTSEDVFRLFINSYVSTIEPHTSYYSPRGVENFKIHMRLSLEGIGAVLQTDEEYTLVKRIIPGGPADLSGILQPNDRIVGVGQTGDEIIDVIGWRLDDVVDMIRGPKESVVTLEILPADTGLNSETRTLSIKRDQINLEEQAASSQVIAVDSSFGKSRVGVITLPSFYSDFEGRRTNDPDYRSTTRDVRKLLHELAGQEISGLVMDLRGNGGGSLTEAISLTGLFIDEGPIVQVRHSTGRTKIDRDPDPGIIYEGPLAVLVDRHSASASEIFAGAIQDYNRGLVIGEPTFGKGTVQNLVNLNRLANSNMDLGQLKITVAQFFRVNGESTQYRGVIPDIIWPTSHQEAESGERQFDNAMPWKRITDIPYSRYQADMRQDILDKIIFEHQERIEENPDFIYALEIGMLNKTSRDRMHVSLSESNRKTDLSEQRLRLLEIENRKRQAKGEILIDSIEHLADGITASGNSGVDAFLHESGHILSDYANISNTALQGHPDAILVNQLDGMVPDIMGSN